MVWGALITPKTKPIQQRLNCMNYYKDNNNIYSIPWIKIKEIGQNIDNENSIIHKHRNKFFGSEIDTRL